MFQVHQVREAREETGDRMAIEATGVKQVKAVHEAPNQERVQGAQWGQLEREVKWAQGVQGVRVAQEAP